MKSQPLMPTLQKPADDIPMVRLLIKDNAGKLRSRGLTIYNATPDTAIDAIKAGLAKDSR